MRWLAGLLAIVAVYLAAVFIFLVPNPLDWKESGRAMFIWCAVMAGFVAVAVQK